MNKMYCEHCGYQDGETNAMWVKRVKLAVSGSPVNTPPALVRFTDHGWFCQYCMDNPDHSRFFDAHTGASLPVIK